MKNYIYKGTELTNIKKINLITGKNSIAKDNFIDSLKKEKNTTVIAGFEKGLHYTEYNETWHRLYKSVIMFDFTLFVTTHSKEVVESFIRISEATQAYNQFRFFELFKHHATGQLLANSNNDGQLEYKVTHNSPFRGE